MRLTSVLRRMFSSLATRNFRIYLIGQVISNTGTWMQSIAMSWLVIRVTGSGVDLGLVSAASFLPVLIFGTFAGVVVDRFPRRTILLITQSLFLLQALGFFVLTYSGSIKLWMIFALSLFFGAVNTVDPTARQSFVEQLAGRDRLQNAVSLNSVTFNASRAVGPAIAGILILTVGLSYAFLFNAISFIAVIAALFALRKSEMYPYQPQVRSKGQVREGLAYVREHSILAVTLIGIFLVGTLAYNFNVTLPLLAKYTFHGNAGTLSLLTSCFGVGAIAGGLWTALAADAKLARLAKLAAVFALAMLGLTISPNVWLASGALLLMGAFSLAFIAQANSLLQLNSEPALRGRVMALYSVGFLGSTPIGSPIIGWVAQTYGVRWSLLLGVVSIAVTAWLFHRWAVRKRVAALGVVEATTIS
ncbi:MAG: MFS transporter [Acidimicrobiales bacterium]